MWWVYARWHQGKPIGEGATSRLQAATLTEQPQWAQTCFELAQALATESAGDEKTPPACIKPSVRETDGMRGPAHRACQRAAHRAPISASLLSPSSR